MAKIEKAIWQVGSPQAGFLPYRFGGLINKITLSSQHSSVHKQVSAAGSEEFNLCVSGAQVLASQRLLLGKRAEREETTRP